MDGTGTMFALATALRDECNEPCRLEGRDRAVLLELDREWYADSFAEVGREPLRGPVEVGGESAVMVVDGGSILFTLGISILGKS